MFSSSPKLEPNWLDVDLYTHSLFLSVHDGLQLLKVSQFDLKLLHLSLHQQSHQRLDLPLLHCCQVLQGQRGIQRKEM